MQSIFLRTVVLENFGFASTASATDNQRSVVQTVANYKVTL